MKKILLSAAAFVALTGVALAEPIKLTNDQMDQVAAGFFDNQQNFNNTEQYANAYSSATGVCVVCVADDFSTQGSAFSSAYASNYNSTYQQNDD